MKDRFVLASVSDKKNLEMLGLLPANWKIISTGGTAEALTKVHIPNIPVKVVTGYSEMLDGLVKTLHPILFLGILAERKKPEHMAVLLAEEIRLIDLVVVNLYPFTTKPSIPTIDIGGVALLRAASKNSQSVTVVVDPDDYQKVISEIEDDDQVCEHTRETLAIKAFMHTGLYDLSIAQWMFKQKSKGVPFLQGSLTLH